MVQALVGAGGFLLAVLWFDLMFDVQVVGLSGTSMPEEVLASDSGTFADLDGDGMQDLVLSGGVVFVLRGHGDCTFDAPRLIGQACDFPIDQTLVTATARGIS
jgi:hypothetical protein